MIEQKKSVIFKIYFYKYIYIINIYINNFKFNIKKLKLSLKLQYLDFNLINYVFI